MINLASLIPPPPTHQTTPKKQMMAVNKQIKLAFVILSMISSVYAAPNITMSDKPVRIIRGVQVFKAPVGTPVQKDDIIETAAGFTQIEISDDLMLLLAPDSKLYLRNIKGHKELVLLSGWLKAFNKTSPLTIHSSQMRIQLESGVSIVYTSEHRSETFAEDGGQTVSSPNDKTPQKVGREQYAHHQDGQPLKVLPRPAKEFISAVPAPFHAPLIALGDKVKKAQVSEEAKVNYPDIAPWLNSKLDIRHHLAQRFKTRLSDPHFRQQIERQLGHTPEWKRLLHPPKTH